MDRFATMTNTQLPRFNSRFADPQTEGVDALAQNNWGPENNYCVPPFKLIPDILRVVKSQKAHATLIVPMWSGQAWYQEIANLAVTQSPVYLMTNCRSVLANHEPLRNHRWTLVAWRICGRDT